MGHAGREIFAVVVVLVVLLDEPMRGEMTLSPDRGDDRDA
jgi:hypothetical protein